MDLKHKLILLAMVSALVIALLGACLYFSVRSLNFAMDKDRVASQITKNVFDRRIFLDDYLASHLDRATQQWLAAHEQVVAYVQSQSPKFSQAGEKVLIEDMNGIFDKNKALFLQLVAIHEANIGREGETIAIAQETRLAGQLLVLSQSLIASAGQLRTISQQDAVAAENNIVIILAGFIASLFLFTIIVVSFLWKSIISPIGKLRRGAEIVGGGNLEYKVGTKSTDEIGQLSRAFDEMTGKVKDRTMKLDASNQQLQASNQQLRASNQQLDAATQQLRAANQQLAATGKGLEEKIKQLEIFNKATVGRELKMADLKKEIERLKNPTQRL